MEIVKEVYNSKNDHHCRLKVYGSVHFDDKFCFSGYPWIYLYTCENNKFWDNHQIGIAIHDQRNYDMGYVYEPGEERFIAVLRELINWINDLEHGVCSYWDYIQNIEGFFPDLDCKKSWW